MTAAIVAVDPGLSGAIAVLDEDGELVELFDTPTVTTTTNRREISASALAAILRKFPGTPAAVERVGPRPGEGAVGAFAFGHGFGTVLACLAVVVKLFVAKIDQLKGVFWALVRAPVCLG